MRRFLGLDFTIGQVPDATTLLGGSKPAQRRSASATPWA
jgi:hypothetical protein